MSSTSKYEAGTTSEQIVPASPLTIDERMAMLEARIVSLEADRARFMHALQGALEMMLEHPMASAMMPKNMRKDLALYLEQSKNGKAS